MAEAQQEIVEDTLSSDLAAAWDEAEQERDDDEVDQQPEPTEHTAEPSGGGEPVEEADTDVHAEAVPGDIDKSEGDEREPSDAPPVGLSATARESWKDTPDAIKAELTKREKDFATGIQKYAESAQRAQQMDQALAPYQQLFAMNGGKPSETINGLLQTASALQMGNPVQRAQTVANLISQFGVDIRTLDGLLSGTAQPEAPQQVQLPPDYEEMKQYVAQMKQREAQSAQAGQQQMMSELQQFSTNPQNEFYSDVAMDMADILEMAGKRNMNMPLDEAYRRACQLHPEVSKIINSRAAVPSASKRRAASSVSGSPSGGGDDSLQSDSITDAINRAWDMSERI